MAQKTNAGFGEILDAIEDASDKELRILRDIKSGITRGNGAPMRVTRSNGAPNPSPQSASETLIREIVRNTRQSNTRNGVNGAAYMRNKSGLNSQNSAIARKAAKKIVNTPTTRRNMARDDKGRFVSASKVGGNTIIVNPRAPKQPQAKSLYSTTPTKSAQQQAKIHADAQRDAVEEQTKETIARQDTTNDLLAALGLYVDDKSASLLQQVVDHLSDLIGVTKDGQKDDQKTSDSSKVKATNQPAPASNIPLQGVGQAFDEMIRGLF